MQTAQALLSRILSNQQHLQENLLHIQAIMISSKCDITYERLEDWIEKQKKYLIQNYALSKSSFFILFCAQIFHNAISICVLKLFIMNLVLECRQ